MKSRNQSELIVKRQDLIEELVELFVNEGIVVMGARELNGYKPPISIPNDGYGDSRPKLPDVVGFDRKKQRVIFGVVRMKRESLDSEESLTEYNVFLDHRAGKGDKASVLYVLVPHSLLHELTSIITHYVHREYWHRIIPVISRNKLQQLLVGGRRLAWDIR